MRIIAGTARSLPLKTVEGPDTRPTTDRIKETLFNILSADVRDAVVLDLFAGSGALGLEAVSRGAKRAVFVDRDKRAAAVIRENIRFTGFDAQCEVLCTDYLRAIETLTKRERFDLLFLDPPYGQGLAGRALAALSARDLCAKDALVVAEESLAFAPKELAVGGFAVVRVKRYKTNQHIFLMEKEEASDPDAMGV